MALQEAGHYSLMSLHKKVGNRAEQQLTPPSSHNFFYKPTHREWEPRDFAPPIIDVTT